MQAYKDAPEIVRAVYDADSTVQIIVELQTKYKLHVDDAGLLGTGIGNMLLGLVNPQEFLQELIAAGIPDKDAREIMTEINQKIFVPLREEMRKGMPAAAEPAKPVAPNVVQPASYFHLENKLPVRPAPPAPPRPPASNIAPLPPKMVLPRSGGLPPAQLPTARPMDTSRLLEDHEEPHIEFPALPTPISTTKVPRPPQRTAETPLQQALRTVLPRPAEVSNAGGPPPNLPGALPPRIPPNVEPPISQLQPKPAPPVIPPPAPARPYSSDPYREPIE